MSIRHNCIIHRHAIIIKQRDIYYIPTVHDKFVNNKSNNTKWKLVK